MASLLPLCITRPLLQRATCLQPPHGWQRRPLTSLAESTRPIVTIIRTATDDPFFNLAFEEHMFKQHFSISGKGGDQPPRHTLFLWRNRPCVIYGKHQNPFTELNVGECEARGLEMVRRKSGGGCVYQDLGNSIFTFISRDQPSAIPRNNALLVEALARAGVPGAQATGRNDVHVDGRKVSGSAFMRQHGWLLHHGTMLLDVDFSVLGQVLTPSKAKLQAKGVTSVAARVLNLRSQVPSLDHAAFCSALASAFSHHHAQRAPPGSAASAGDTGGTRGAGPSEQQVEQQGQQEQQEQRQAEGVVVREEEVGPSLLQREPGLRALYDGLREWGWRFGRTPPFTHRLETRFDWGTMDVLLDCKGGTIQSATIYSDCLQPLLVEELQRALCGARYDPSSVLQAVHAAKAALTHHHQQQQQAATAGGDMGAQCDQFGRWLAAQVAA